MIFLWIFLIVLALLSGGYILLVKGRKNHPGLQALRGWSYAHRGLHDEKRPENSMAAFRAALENGYGIELDVHLLRDGSLAVFHDHSLERMAGKTGNVEDLTREQLSEYYLGSSLQTIPTFEEVLELFSGKAPMIIELKAIGGNHGKLVDRVMAVLADYKGTYCIESFDPRCIRYLKKHYPQVIRGQLAENFLKTKGKLPWILKFCLSKQLFNAAMQPDFVAYRFADRKTLGNAIVRKIWGVQGVSWTLKTQEEHDTAIKEGWLPIFEDYKP